MTLFVNTSEDLQVNEDDGYQGGGVLHTEQHQDVVLGGARAVRVIQGPIVPLEPHHVLQQTQVTLTIVTWAFLQTFEKKSDRKFYINDISTTTHAREMNYIVFEKFGIGLSFWSGDPFLQTFCGRVWDCF